MASEKNGQQAKMLQLNLPEPYQRGISSSLSLVEERLSEIERLLKNESNNSIFEDVKSRLTPQQKQEIRQEIKNIRDGISDIKSTLKLKKKNRRDSVLISSICASIWETLSNLETKRLRRYGPNPKGLADYLDPKIQELVRYIEHIVDSIEKGR